MNRNKWLIAFALLFVTSTVYAQSYPARSIRVIVPYPAGGGADFVARIYAKSLSDSLGQQLTVDNRGGVNSASVSCCASRADLPAPKCMTGEMQLARTNAAAHFMRRAYIEAVQRWSSGRIGVIDDP